MPDREKVINDAKEALNILDKVDEPTFWLDFVKIAVYELLLLKEHEPVKPTLDKYTNYTCGNCGRMITRAHKFCPECGRRVRWDG